MTDSMTKRPWPSLALLPLALGFALPACALHAQESQPAKKIDVTRFTANVEDVVIPVPSEIFTALDKLGGSPNWTGTLPTKESSARPKVQAQIALLLGDVIADGFIAVEAKDSKRVEDIGRRVIELANALGVGKAVIPHCSAIIDAAKDDKWDQVRSELDKTQNSVREAMRSLHSKDQSELVSIGGWLRGTDALTTLVRAGYNADRADLLHQPDMLNTFDRQFEGMEDHVKADKMVVEVREGFKKIKTMMTTKGDEAISQKNVNDINDITAGLVKNIAPPAP